MADKRLAEYRRLLGYLKRYRRQASVAYGGMLIVTLLNLAVPQVIRAAIDIGLASGEVTALVKASLIILAIGLVRAVAGVGQRYYGEWLTHRIAFDLRNDFYDSVQHLPFSFHDRTQTGDLMSRATSDIAETERFVGIGFMDLTATILLLVGVIMAMILVDLRLAVVALIPIPFLVAATIRFGRLVRPRFKRIQEQIAVLSTTMQESLTGIRVVKAFAREPYELAKFERENDTWFQRRYRVIRLWANNWPFFTFTLSISIFLLLWFGGPQVMTGVITVGTLFAMISYVLMLNGPIQRLGFLVNLAATAGASAGRVFEIMELPGEVMREPGAHNVERLEGKVVFQGVSFAYSGRQPVLEDVSFSVEPGQTIALMGLTGSGKSTITNLIPRFYDVSDGRVMVDDIDTCEWELADLRRHIGIVLQDSFLFSATIAENIA
jgi:ATP-binding cassette subfamily B multidrug efflux pump